MVKDIKKLNSDCIVRIVYNRRKRTAQLQTRLYDDAYLKGELKFSIKGMELIREIFADIMQSENIHKDYVYKSKTLEMPEIESYVNLISIFSKSIGPYAKCMLSLDLQGEELAEHMHHLEAYRGKCSWAVSSVVTHDRGKTKETPVVQPQGAIPGMIPSGGGMVIGADTPWSSPNTIPQGRSHMSNMYAEYASPVQTPTMMGGMAYGHGAAVGGMTAPMGMQQPLLTIGTEQPRIPHVPDHVEKGFSSIPTPR
jgi:hypothetical protein